MDVCAPKSMRRCVLVLTLLFAGVPPTITLAGDTSWEFYNPLDPYHPNPSHLWRMQCTYTSVTYGSVSNIDQRYSREFLPGGSVPEQIVTPLMAAENACYGKTLYGCTYWVDSPQLPPLPPLPNDYLQTNRPKNPALSTTLADGMILFYELGGVLSTRHTRCNNGYSVDGDPYIYGQIIRQYVLDPCPVKPLTPLPESDACAKSLDEGRGQDINGACTAYRLTPEMESAAVCLANKITSIGVPYSGPTATIRNPAYQNHLAEIWEKWKELSGLRGAKRQLCAAREATIRTALDQHGVTSPPPPYNPNDSHVTGNAIDVSRTTVRQVIDRILTDPRWMELACYTDVYGLTDYVRSSAWNPPACPLFSGAKWPGEWYDPVHFQYQPLNTGATCP